VVVEKNYAPMKYSKMDFKVCMNDKVSFNGENVGGG